MVIRGEALRERGGFLRKALMFAALTATLALWGCAKAPRRPVEPPAPPPLLRPTPQEAALDRALKDFAKAPYRSGGVTPAGVDCSGLVMAVYQRLGLALPRTAADQFTTGEPVLPGRLRFGDVVFFNRLCQVRSGPYLANMLPSADVSQICHTGIYIGGGRFIHASRRGVEITRMDAEVWRASFVGARRFFQENPKKNPR
jgi:cell wall-associated NlpC family hydrolase